MDRETVDEIKRHFGIVVEDVRSDVRGVAEGVDALRNEMHRENRALREEAASTREDLRGEIRAVAGAGNDLRREFGGLREEFDEFRGNVAEEFEETRALVRVSYGQIDQRVRTLETEMADVRERLERVEGRTSG